MKRLLIISDLFPNKYHPEVESFVQFQTEELAKYYDVRIIATKFPHRHEVISRTDGLNITYIFFPCLKGLNLSTLLTYRIFAIPVIVRMIKNWQPQLIHVHDCRNVPELFWLYHILKRTRIPRFLTVHNLRTHPDMLPNNSLHWLYKMLFGMSYRNWNHIFTVNDKINQIISKYSGYGRVTTIGNAVGPVKPYPKDEIQKYSHLLKPLFFKIITVGNLKREKGFDYLIRAIHNLIKQNYKVQLVIVGSGTEASSLKQLIAELGLEQNVILTGGLDNTLVRNLYPLFDAFVLPSYSETFGIVYLEAMYAGLPVIGVKGQGIDGVIVQGENGMLTEPCNVDDLAAKILYLIHHPDECKVMAQKGMNLVKEHYQLSQLVNKIKEFYEQ